MLFRGLWPRTLLIAALSCGGCAPADPGPEPAIPTEAPYIYGVVTASSSTEIRVKEDPSEPSGSAKAIFRLADSTAVLHRSGEPATRSDLVTGTIVSTWVTGPVMESYPVQATARTVVVESAQP